MFETISGISGFSVGEMQNIAQTWKEWLAVHGPRLLLFARGWASAREDAEDLVQDAVIRMWNHQRERGGQPPDLPLMFSTIRFCGLNHHRSETRRRKREESIVYLHDFRDVWLDPTLEADEEALVMRRAVESLTPKLREVVIMKFWSGLTFHQISEALAISPNTAASRYRYAMETLARKLHEWKEVRHAEA